MTFLTLQNKRIGAHSPKTEIK